ncbi:SDR family NAD(P)-dependent oxidoreductase [Cryptosporangium japonicum]|uniref:SDR family NAD(P)-dependent oxidoreductase n=1 Tax=Cryptosporangium japonicum TaxID=80872 RepID=A0ABN0UEF8_9ACTN
MVIVGAGPGLGSALARRFGAEGYDVGLVARDRTRLETDAATLRAAGVAATAHPADVRDEAGLRAALDAAGPIDVLIWAVGPGSAPIAPAGEVTAPGVIEQVALHVGGAVTAVRHVLPPMLTRGAGTVLIATGASSVVPIAVLGDVGIAMAGLRNWALGLRAAVAGQGVHVATVTIATLLAPGHPVGDPDAVAARFLALAGAPERAEEVIGDLDEVRRLVG